MSSPAQVSGTLAYISHYFPALTQTFVYREVQALEDLGWKVKPFSIRRPTKGISEDAKDLASRTTYLLPLPWLRSIGRVARLLLRRPVRSARILAHMLASPGESARSRLHGLTHFFGGLYLAEEVEPIAHDDWIALSRYLLDIQPARVDDYVAALTGAGPLRPAADPEAGP